ncbi:hypothetical protein KCU98_g5651, partial [Aureobasidium melanogenum]
MDNPDRNKTWVGDYDSDEYPESPNFLSDNSDIEDYEDWEDSRGKLRVEPSFDLQETSVQSNIDVDNSVELHQSLLSYGTDFDELATQDPVHKRILELVVEKAPEPEIILFSKVNLVKLATIHKVKASNLDDAILSSMMQAVSLAQDEEAVRRETQNKEEKTIRDCIDQLHWLIRKNHLQEHVAGILKKIIKASHYEIPSVIRKTRVDDLCGILYAIISDDYYKDAPVAVEISNPSQIDDITATTSDPKLESKPLKHIPHAGTRFGINLITHLTLIGGRPMHVEKFYTTDKATFSGVTRKISSSLESSRSSHRKRLGCLSQEEMRNGNWLYQIASDFESLNMDYAAWKIFDAPSLGMMPSIQEKQVFMIHEYHLGMPARIEEKVRGRPKVWNTWNLLVSLTLTSPPAPEFVPCSKGIIIKPASMGMAALSKALPKPQAKGPHVEKQEVKKERRNKRNKQKKNKGQGMVRPATFQLPLR